MKIGRLSNPSMAPIADAILGFRKGMVLFSAVRLGIFDAFAGSPKGAEKISESLKLDVESCRILLNALVSMDLLAFDSKRYGLTDLSRTYLLKTSPTSFVHNLLYQDQSVPGWSSLAEIVRSGRKNRTSLASRITDRSFTNEYLLGMQELSRDSAREVAEVLSRGNPRRILDVGAGPGRFTTELLKRVPTCRADLMDLGGAIKFATKHIERDRALAGRIRYIVHDYRKGGLGANKYDLVLFSNITHDEDAKHNLDLFAKAHDVLIPGGRLAVHDFVTNSDGTAPLFGALFSVHLMTYTQGGRTYSESNYRRWFGTAGFEIENSVSIGSGKPNESKLIVGIRRR